MTTLTDKEARDALIDSLEHSGIPESVRRQRALSLTPSEAPPAPVLPEDVAAIHKRIEGCAYDLTDPVQMFNDLQTALRAYEALLAENAHAHATNAALQSCIEGEARLNSALGLTSKAKHADRLEAIAKLKAAESCTQRVPHSISAEAFNVAYDLLVTNGYDHLAGKLQAALFPQPAEAADSVTAAHLEHKKGKSNAY